MGGAEGGGAEGGGAEGRERVGEGEGGMSPWHQLRPSAEVKLVKYKYIDLVRNYNWK